MVKTIIVGIILATLIILTSLSYTPKQQTRFPEPAPAPTPLLLPES